jgi:hypothetical protein
MLKASIHHPIFYIPSTGGQLDRSSGTPDTSIIIIEAQGQDGTRSWNVRDTVRPGEKYLGHTFEELAGLIATGKTEVEL